jgi:hypothetical protein
MPHSTTCHNVKSPRGVGKVAYIITDVIATSPSPTFAVSYILILKFATTQNMEGTDIILSEI